MNNALWQYGPLHAHNTEETRSGVIGALFGRIIAIFKSAIINKPESLLESSVTRKGRIQHHFVTFDSIIVVVFIEAKKELSHGDVGLKMKTQLLAESAAYDS